MRHYTLTAAQTRLWRHKMVALRLDARQTITNRPMTNFNHEHRFKIFPRDLL